jgi:Protein of unknown function (DUF3433)
MWESKLTSCPGENGSSTTSQLRKIVKTSNQHVPNWQPWCYHPSYLSAVALLHVIFVIGSGTIYGVYQSRGSRSTGPSFVFWDDNAGFWAASQYIPLIFALLVVFMWDFLDSTIRKLEPYYQMSQPSGASLEHSLFLDYYSMFPLYAVLRAWQSQHWAVCLSSLGLSLSKMLLMPLATTLFHYTWPNHSDNLTPEEVLATVNKGPLFTYLVLNIILAGIALAVAKTLRSRRTGLLHHPTSIAATAAFVAGNPVVDILSAIPSYQDNVAIINLLRNARVFLRWATATAADGTPTPCHQLHISVPNLDLFREQAAALNFRQTRFEAHPLWLTKRCIFGIWVLIMVPSILVSALSPPANSQTIPPTVAKGLLSLIVMLNSSLTQGQNRALLAMWPWRTLAGSQPVAGVIPDIVTEKQLKRQRQALLADGCPSGPFPALAAALAYGAAIEATNAFVDVVYHFNGVLLPPTIELLLGITDNSTAFPLFALQLAPGLAKYGIACSVLFTVNSIAVFWRTRSIMPRKPGTIGSMVLYVTHSQKLLMRVSGVAVLDETGFREWGRRLDGQHTFGWFSKPAAEGNGWFVGVEEAPRVCQYVYGQTAPDVEA